jgi:hypothetical protein
MPIFKKFKKLTEIYIYEIVCNITGERYIGSTNDINKRKYQHKLIYKFHTASKKIIERGDWNFNVIDTFYTNYQLVQFLKEQWYLDTLPNINKYRALSIRNIKKKQKQICDRNYRHNNIESIKLKKQKYRAKHLEKIKKKHNEYYQKNRDILNEKKGVTIVCECGRKVTKGVKARHLKSTIHKKRMANLSNVLPITQPPHSPGPIV